MMDDVRLRLLNLRGLRALEIELPPVPQVTHGTLTTAEQEVATLILAGLTSQEIGKVRESSLHTVGNQIASIYRKLGVSSRPELARKLRG